MKFSRDRRTPAEQAKSGLRIAGALMVTVATLALLGWSYLQIVTGDRAHNRFTGWMVLLALAVLLGLTVQYWRRWFFFLPGYFGIRSGFWLLLGWFSPRGVVFVVFPILMFAMAVMSFRLSKPPRLRALDRAVLLVTAACLLAAMLEMFTKEPGVRALLFAGIGDLALLLSRVGRTGKQRHRAEPYSASADISG